MTEQKILSQMAKNLLESMAQQQKVTAELVTAINNLAASNMAIVDELAAANDIDGDQGGTLDARNLSDQTL